MTRNSSRLMMALALAALAGIALGAEAGATMTARTDRVLVTPDHRMSEFNVATNPTNPRNLVMGAIDWDDPAGAAGCGIWTSFDGGRSWRRSKNIPGLDVPQLRADPWIAFAPNGNVHMTCLHLPGPPTGSLTPNVDGLEPYLRLVHSVSTDGGITWSTARNVPGVRPNSQRDKESLFVTRTGRVLICANDAPRPDNSLSVYRSDDDGATWLTPVVVSSTGGNCNGFGQAPDGTIYFVGFSFGTGGDALDTTVFVSRDDGDSWTLRKIQGLNWPTEPTWTAEAMVIYPKGTWPSIAVDPTDGNVAVAGTLWDFERKRFWAALYRSTDNGRTFSRIALPVPPENGCTGCHLASPLVTADAKGRLALQTMLFSNDGGMTKEQWLQVSEDDGASWLTPFLVARTDGPAQNWTNPLTWAPRNVQSYADQQTWLIEHPMEADGVASSYGAMTGGVTHHLRLGGDYWSMAATDEGFLAMWNDHLNGYSQIWSRLISVE